MKIQNLFLALIGIAGVSCGPETETASGDSASMASAIKNGTTISNTDRAKYLPVRFELNDLGRNRCSGTLLTNDLVLTNEHCRWVSATPPTADRMIHATARLFNGDGTTTDREVVQSIPHYSNIPNATNPGNSMGADILIVRVSPPYSVDGSTVGYRRMVWPGTFSKLYQPAGRSVTFVGAGADPWVTSPSIDNTFEANEFIINSGYPTSLNYWNDTSRASSQNDISLTAPLGSPWLPEVGDSGSGIFVDSNGQTFLAALNYNGTALTFTSPDIASFLEKETFDTVPIGCVGTLFFGDIDGDGQDDMICHNSISGTRMTRLKLDGPGFQAAWTVRSTPAWCNHAGSKVFVGDFSGDGRADLLCADTFGRKWVDLGPTFDGNSSGGFWNANWCHNPNIMHVGYFDSDAKADLACQEPSTGELWIDLAADFLDGTDWHVNTGWCSHAGSRLLVGKSNEDARSDLICIDTSGSVYIQNAPADGHFSGYSSAYYYSPMLAGTGVLALLADLDGDGRDDILAQQSGSGSGTLNIDFANNGFQGTEWTRTQSGIHSQPSFCDQSFGPAFLLKPRSLDANTVRNRAAELLCQVNDTLQILPR